MNTNKLAKLLALSLFGGALIGCGSVSAETMSTACVKPVRVYGKLNIVGSKTNYQAYLNMRNMLRDLKLVDDNGLLKNVTPVDKSKVNFNYTVTPEGAPAEDMQFSSRSVFNDQNMPLNAPYDPTKLSYIWTDNINHALLNQKAEVAGNMITVTNTFTGNKNGIVPVNGDQVHGAYIDNNGDIAVVANDQLTNLIGTQTAKYKVDSEITGGLPSLGYYGDNVDQITKFANEASAKSIFPGSVKGWQGSISVELGGVFALQMGGFITLGAFFDVPVFGKTKTVELGKEDGSNTKDNNNGDDNNKSNTSSNGWKYDAQEKWSLGCKLGFELPITEKFSVGLVFGFKYSRFSLSATSSDNKNGESTDNKTYFLKQKQEMKGWTIFPELECKFFCTKNMFVNVFGRYYMPYELKEKDSSSKDSNTKDSNNNQNNGFSVSCKNLGGFAFGGGVGFVF